MNPTLLTIIPSRQRPKRLSDTLKSFVNTSAFSELIVELDEDDPLLTEYKSILDFYVSHRVRYHVGNAGRNLTEIINESLGRNPEYDFYSVSNDDIIYETKDWDYWLCNKDKISTGLEPNMVKKYGRKYKGLPVAGFPIISVIDGNIIRRLGWLQYPELRACCGDNVWFWIGRRSKRLHFDKNVIYRHNHYYLGHSEKDDTYKKNSMDKIKADHKVFMNWLKYRIDDTLGKLRKGELNGAGTYS